MEIPKTYKLFINGAFPRSESGRSLPVCDARGRVRAHLCRASRKDLRDAVEAARSALSRWAGMTAYNRAQILYRMAEMLDGRRQEFEAALRAGTPSARRPTAGGGRRARASSGSVTPAMECSAAIDRLVGFAGWADKHAEVLGRRAAVAGPYHVFSVPEPSGVVGVVAPDRPALLGLVVQMAAAIAVGNTAVCLAGEADPVPAAVLGEVLATSDLPPGVVNILTGQRDELLGHLAGHREVRAVLGADLPAAQALLLRQGAAENLKRIALAPREDLAAWLDHDAETSPARLEPLVEIKTVWHPSAM